MEQRKEFNKLTDSLCTRPAINNPRMMLAFMMATEKVAIKHNDHSFHR